MTMDFKKRLEKAVERGHRLGDVRARESAEQAYNEEELRRMHTQYRLELSEHIERCMSELPQHFPGFRSESIVGERGWGAAISRDDLRLDNGQRRNYYSRLEIAVRPYSASHVIDLAAKGTIFNKEVFNRTQYQRLQDIDVTTFTELVDRWILEYAELFAAKT